MFKFLKGVVGSAAGGIKDLPYSIGEPYAASWGSWSHYRGTSKEDNSPVSVFCFTATGLQDGRLAPARNGVKRLRTVRHPNVVSFLHSTEVEVTEGGVTKPTIYIVTEPVMPLSEKIKELNLQGTQMNEYYSWGLHQIAKAVNFLNSDCKLVHGNICLASVVVTPTLDWKLHAFDVLGEFDANNPEPTAPVLPFEWLVSSQYKPMELTKNDWATIRKSPPWAVDAWGLGCLIYELFSNTALSKNEELRNTGSIPKTLLSDYQRLLGSVPSRRLNPSKLIENSEFFQNKLVETIQFMEVLTLKDSLEKDSFFRKLLPLTEQLPRQVVLKKLLPMLGSALEFGSASATALNPYFRISSWLSPEELASKVVPTIIRLFASTDRAIRVGLLQNVEQFGNALPNQMVDEQVFQHLATGFSDTSALLRELTLKSMLVFAPKLSQKTLSNSLLKYLSKLQVDEEPAIRTNTTILLGNIAGLLNEATRKRVLINAFTVRALRDGFAPARGAGIMALTATSQYYDVTEIATRVLPSLVVLTIDVDSDVRTKAFQATETFLQLVKTKVEVGESPASDALLPTTTSGILGWAVNSLTAKPKGSEQTHQSTESLHSSDNPSSALQANSSAPLSQPSKKSQSAVNHWDDEEKGVEEEDGDKDGWDDDMSLDFSGSSTLQEAQRRPLAPASKSQQTTQIDGWSTPADKVETTIVHASSKAQENDEDPWAEIAAPAPAVKAKPLMKTTTTATTTTTMTSRVRQAQHVSLDSVGLGRGRGRGGPMKLGAQRVSRPPSSSS